MSKGEVQGTVKHRVVWIVLIAVFVLVIVLWLISVKMWFTPTFKVETKISAMEQQYIFDLLELESESVTVEKLEYSHAREHVFFVYVAGLAEKDLEEKYALDYYGKYVKNRTVFPNIIECEFVEEDGKKSAKFYLSFYDEMLYETVE